MDNILRLREKINKIDKTIISAIADRYAIAKKIGIIKKKEVKKVQDTDREKWLFEYYRQLCLERKLEAKHIERIFSIIIKQSKKMQKS